ncbi:hypothetical protein IWZ01DRAFT_482415 [Phyllosticta capitalensis]
MTLKQTLRVGRVLLWCSLGGGYAMGVFYGYKAYVALAALKKLDPREHFKLARQKSSEKMDQLKAKGLDQQRLSSRFREWKAGKSRGEDERQELQEQSKKRANANDAPETTKKQTPKDRGPS